jgi:Amino acid permease
MRVGPTRFLFPALLLVAFLSTELNAQTTTSGGLTGVVTDPSHAVVPGADVEIRDTAKGTTQSTKTDRDGFDGVTTLAEDVENPKRNVLLAVVLTCIFAGVCSGFEAYLGARVWPDWRSFPDLVTAYMDVCRRVGGLLLFNAMGAILIVAAFGSGLTGTLGAARLLFGMGRDGVLTKKFFGHLKPGSSTPTYNILLIGGLAFLGAVLLNYIGSAYEHAGELLNFGAFLAFMGVNFACFWQFTHSMTVQGSRGIATRLSLAAAEGQEALDFETISLYYD